MIKLKQLDHVSWPLNQYGKKHTHKSQQYMIACRVMDNVALLKWMYYSRKNIVRAVLFLQELNLNTELNDFRIIIGLRKSKEF